MLCEICIDNLAVIKQAVIPFTENFNVFTGETGAGKSILINGINAVLGKRVSKDIVRSGCDKAVVTALFRGLSDATKEKLTELGIAYDEDELLITREILSDGGSTARINSRTSSVSVLKEIGTTLVDVHGQHDSRILMYPEKHIDIVDNFAALNDDTEDYKESFRKLQEISRRIKKLSADEQYKQSRLDALKITVDEIGAADLSDENEDVRIENEFSVISNSRSISESLGKASAAVSGDDENAGIAEMLSYVIDEIRNYSDIMPKLKELSGRLEELKIEAEDIGGEFVRLGDSIDVDAERLAYLENRRDTIISLKKKYGPELKDVIEKYTSAVEETQSLIDGSEEIVRLSAEKDKLLIEVSGKAKALSEKREKAAKEISRRVEEELKFLDMPDVRLEFVHTTGKLTSTGMDSMEIMISVNTGEPLKPIAKIASGGELSRIMLAIKNVAAEKDDVPTLIFDEIDTGVSGRAAQKIGVKLREISRLRQVLCVTHLSQIAVMADSHLLIEKSSDSEHTYTTVSKLDKKQRIDEIARILCGGNITETALKNAEEQLDTCDEVCRELLAEHKNK